MRAHTAMLSASRMDHGKVFQASPMQNRKADHGSRLSYLEGLGTQWHAQSEPDGSLNGDLMGEQSLQTHGEPASEPRGRAVRPEASGKFCMHTGMLKARSNFSIGKQESIGCLQFKTLS